MVNHPKALISLWKVALWGGLGWVSAPWIEVPRGWSMATMGPQCRSMEVQRWNRDLRGLWCGVLWNGQLVLWLGWFYSLLINPLGNVWYCMLYLGDQKLPGYIAWLCLVMRIHKQPGWPVLLNTWQAKGRNQLGVAGGFRVKFILAEFFWSLQKSFFGAGRESRENSGGLFSGPGLRKNLKDPGVARKKGSRCDERNLRVCTSTWKPKHPL